MAIFDPHEQRLCVRVVYDGFAGAGKTTNLRQLATLFAAQRATEVWSPAELAGRTLFFDWMQLNAGVVAGIPLLCQIISVPGQVALTPRRRHLLATADVIVYVCDSHVDTIQRAKEGLALIDSLAQERGTPLPLVIQANKQDQAGALDGARVLRAFDRADASFVDAIAVDGIGVVDTFVTGVRTLSRAMQARSDDKTLHIEVRRAETKERALSEMEALALDPESAAEMLLQEAAASLLVEEVAASVSDTSVPNADPGKDVGESLVPLLPHADVPTGFIWPAHTGRSILRTLAGTGALGAKPMTSNEGITRHSACGWLLRTDTSRRFDAADAAQQALVRAARHRTQLDQLLVPDTVVVAQSSDDGRWWLWTVMPELPSLSTVLGETLEPSARNALLDSYGVALVNAVSTSLRHGFGVDVRPDQFGVDGTLLRYLGDTSAPQTSSELATAVIDALGSLCLPTPEVEAVLAAFDRELQRQLTRDDLASTASVVSATRALMSTVVGDA